MQILANAVPFIALVTQPLSPARSFEVELAPGQVTSQMFSQTEIIDAQPLSPARCREVELAQGPSLQFQGFDEPCLFDASEIDSDGWSSLPWCVSSRNWCIFESFTTSDRMPSYILELPVKLPLRVA